MTTTNGFLFYASRSASRIAVNNYLYTDGLQLISPGRGFLCGPISFGDVIEALPTNEKDVVLLQRCVKRAGLKRACYIMPRDMAEKPCFAELMSRIQDSGGFAAVDFQGVFLVFLPKTCGLDVSLELKRIAAIPKSTRLHLLKSGLKWRLQQRWKKTVRWLANFP